MRKPNGTKGKKQARIQRAKDRAPRTLEARKAAAGQRERARNGW